MSPAARAARTVNLGVKRVAIDTLKGHPENFRVGDVDGVRESIRANGFYGVVVARPDGTILVGKHRWQAAIAEGLTELDVMFVKVDARTARRIVMADNAYADRGGYDLELLTALVPKLGTQLEGTGYDADRLATMLGTAVKPEPPKKTRAVRETPTGESDEWMVLAVPVRLSAGANLDIVRMTVTDAVKAALVAHPEVISGRVAARPVRRHERLPGVGAEVVRWST